MGRLPVVPWARKQSRPPLPLRSPVAREESVRLVLARAFYGDTAGFSTDAAVLLDAFLFAAYLDTWYQRAAVKGPIGFLLKESLESLCKGRFRV